MQMRQLRYFVTVADLGSFTRAAARCLVAQPSLSQQIIKLERELGQPLLERLGRTVRLTPAGQDLYDHAVPLLAALDALEERVKTAADPGLGTVRVGAIPTVAPYWLPALLHRFGKKFPRATVALQENLTALTVRSCLEGDLDVGIIASAVDDELLDAEPLFTEELLLTLPARHPLLKKKAVALDDLAGQPFVLMNEAHCLGEQIVNFCRERECLPVVRCRSTQLLTVQELVALGHGISLVPAMARHAGGKGKVYTRALSGPRPTRTLTMIWHRYRHQPALVKAFIALLREAAAAEAKA